ncbi:MAG: leucine-rich repeat protein [Candidatus Egerieousia sp.]|nr:leucine-rich repeat protein [Candidatus Egerieousia sp.]
MKKILLFASAALLFAGCAKENIIPTDENGNNSQKGELTLSFSASQAGFGTKAAIGETTIDAEGAKSTAINWQESDKISVFDGAGANCEFSTKDFSTETTTSCTFEGNVKKLATDYVAVYPYTAAATISETGIISGVTLPATQTAVEGSFDPSAALMAAKTVAGGRDLAFQNLVGYVKVATDFDCKKIELCAASEEALAGAGTISFNEGTPSFALGEGAVSTITLLPEGEGTIAAGKTYYIAVPATTLAAGWKISFTAPDDKVYSRQGTKPIQFKTNTVLNLGTIKLDDLIPYVTFTAESEQTFNMYRNFFPLGENEYFEYSVGGGKWVGIEAKVENIKFGGNLGNLRLRGKSSKGTSLSDDAYYGYAYSEIRFTTNNSPVDCTGDIRTLIDYEDYANANTTDARFCKLFNLNEELRTAPSLPAQSLASRCYYAMFSGCTSLTTAPALPAETLAEYCYEEMFLGCSALTEAPELPAETLADNCYTEMFLGCSALTETPKLPATTLASSCYKQMFYGCSALAEAPKLPAKTLAGYCYQGMFWGCTALKTAPELSAHQLGEYCCQNMFYGCTSLETAPMLHVVFSLAADCFAGMFYNCTKLSSVTLFIEPGIDQDVNPHFYLSNWLNGAGTDVQEPQKPILYLLDVFYLNYYNDHRNDWTNESLFHKNWSVQPLNHSIPS